MPLKCGTRASTTSRAYVCTVMGKGRALHGAQWTKVRERRADSENPMTLRINMTPAQFRRASSAFQDLPGLGFPSRTLGCHLRCPKYQLTSGQFWQEQRTSSCYWHVVDPKPYLVLPSLCVVLCTREPSPFRKRWALSVNLILWNQKVSQSLSNKPIVNFHWIRTRQPSHWVTSTSWRSIQNEAGKWENHPPSKILFQCLADVLLLCFCKTL